MSETTNISWCDSTWNPWRGCDKVSPGCINCYITTTTPFRTTGQKHGDPRVLASESTFNAPLAWNKKKQWVCYDCEHSGTGLGDAPLDCLSCDKCGMPVHRRRVFSLSLGDWLDPEVPIEWLARMLDIIRRCDGLDFLLLTKRPELWRKRIDAVVDAMASDCESEFFDSPEDADLAAWLNCWTVKRQAPANIWIGTSVEDKPRKSRIDELLKIPARVRFLSLEPLLEDPGELDLTGIHWVIIGGESGPRARPCNIEWIRSIKEQCQAAGAPVFVKQLGSRHFVRDSTGHVFTLGTVKHPKGGDPAEWPEDLRVQQFPDSRIFC